ncbi:S26 family signal peptidase [Halomicrobium urmianum]|uniref:S26 family signal peptidase n=1 Tax=Halomicrobium urmianum TaxID=1586233 RepID=UPI001CD9FDC2|nr:S26 family signal peptidase [Halomicrobium urmianum]
MSDDPRRGESDRTDGARDPSRRPDDEGPPRGDGDREIAGGEPRRAEPAERADDVDWQVYAYDLVSSVAAVALVGAFLFAVSGVWPPLVAIESPSMTPHIQKGDLVFVMEEERFSGDGAVGETGVVPAQSGAESDYRTFQGYGDVIVYQPDGNARETPIIHRAMFWVEEGENWYDRADEEYVGTADNCEELSNCPADQAGFVTKGDYNHQYDQVGSRPLSDPVRPEWVIGTAEARVPLLGEIRLRSGGVGAAPAAATPSPNEGGVRKASTNASAACAISASPSAGASTAGANATGASAAAANASAAAAP